MKTRLIRLATVALLACTSQVSLAQDVPQPQPLPTVQASTLLFLLYFWGGTYADTADPIDINAFNIDFGDDSNSNSNGKSDSTTKAVDALLHDN